MKLSSKEIARLPKNARDKLKGELASRPQGQNKYGAKHTTILMPDGTRRRFDSAKEADRYIELCLRMQAGEISDLRCQVEFILIPKQVRPDGKKEQPVKYIADFTYMENGELVVEDVKGYRNPSDPAYRLFTVKRKLMLATHRIVVKEV